MHRDGTGREVRRGARVRWIASPSCVWANSMRGVEIFLSRDAVDTLFTRDASIVALAGGVRKRGERGSNLLGAFVLATGITDVMRVLADDIAKITEGD